MRPERRSETVKADLASANLASRKKVAHYLAGMEHFNSSDEIPTYLLSLVSAIKTETDKDVAQELGLALKNVHAKTYSGSLPDTFWKLFNDPLETARRNACLCMGIMGNDIFNEKDPSGVAELLQNRFHDSSAAVQAEALRSLYYLNATRFYRMIGSSNISMILPMLDAQDENVPHRPSSMADF